MSHGKKGKWVWKLFSHDSHNETYKEEWHIRSKEPLKILKIERKRINPQKIKPTVVNF